MTITQIITVLEEAMNESRETLESRWDSHNLWEAVMAKEYVLVEAASITQLVSEIRRLQAQVQRLGDELTDLDGITSADVDYTSRD